MKKGLSKRAGITLTVLGVFLAGVFLLLWCNGIIVFDHTARVGTEGTLWNGKSFISLSAGCYETGRRIAKEEPGRNDFGIYELKGDPSHRFIVAKGKGFWTDVHLYVDEDYQIPDSGKITKVCWNKNCIEDARFLQAINDIESIMTTSFEYEVTDLWLLGDIESIHFAYEDCPLATEYKGYMGKLDGKWVITTHIPSPSEQVDEIGNKKPYKVGFFSIPDEYADVLSEHFK